MATKEETDKQLVAETFRHFMDLNKLTETEFVKYFNVGYLLTGNSSWDLLDMLYFSEGPKSTPMTFSDIVDDVIESAGGDDIVVSELLDSTAWYVETGKIAEQSSMLPIAV